MAFLTDNELIYKILPYKLPDRPFEKEITKYSNLVIQGLETNLDKSFSKSQIAKIKTKLHHYCLPILKKVYINTYYPYLSVNFRYIPYNHLKKMYERCLDPSQGYLFRLTPIPWSIALMEYYLQLTLWRIALVYEDAVIQKTMQDIAATPKVREAINLTEILLDDQSD